MKLIEIVNAGSAMQHIVTQQLPLKLAYKLTMLVNILNPHLAFFDARKAEIQETLNSGDTKELEELLNTEIDIGDFEKVDIDINSNIVLAPTDIMSLDKFVNIID